ncbi:hypothetical protein [Micromonospora sp. NPDC005206]|uniref:hypothetical protein n=1 Tax=Micromonospora sp. NPDC005206 TaxID=3157022 RepID=UPI0033B88CBE
MTDPGPVVWGTDSPFVDYEMEFTKMRRVAGSDAAHEMVFGGNLARILGLTS